jgi:hypothetical protein
MLSTGAGAVGAATGVEASSAVTGAGMAGAGVALGRGSGDVLASGAGVGVGRVVGIADGTGRGVAVGCALGVARTGGGVIVGTGVGTGAGESLGRTTGFCPSVGPWSRDGGGVPLGSGRLQVPADCASTGIAVAASTEARLRHESAVREKKMVLPLMTLSSSPKSL